MEALWMGYPWLKTACQSSMLSKNGNLVNFTIYIVITMYAVLGNMQLAPHVRSLRLKSRGAVPNKGQPCELAQMLSI